MFGMRILIAPDKFKGSLSARQVAENIALGIGDIIPDAQIEIAPVADGGEGTAEVICNARGGEWVTCRAHGPLGDAIEVRRTSIASPSGPCARHVTHSPPRALQITSAVPSPPSATGAISICASGITSRIPSAMCSATCRALSEPLNLSGAMRMRISNRDSRPQLSLQNLPYHLRIRFSFR